MKEFYDKNKSKGIVVYAVNIEDSREQWVKYIKEHKLDWINVSNSAHQYYLKNLYDIYSTPVIYVLDENKKIVAKRLAVEDMMDFDKFAKNVLRK